MNEINTLTLDELIQVLTMIKRNLKKDGIENADDIKVLLSSDSEGNSYNTLSKENPVYSFDYVPSRETKCGDLLIIYPYEEGLDVLDF